MGHKFPPELDELMYYRILILIVLIAAPSNMHADDALDGPRIQRLIDQLGDDSFLKREAAEDELIQKSEPVLPQLHTAARTNRDFEIRYRAKRAIGRIMLALCQSRTLGMKFAYVGSGEFQMGSHVSEKDRRDDESQHMVRITQPFLMGTHEVTQDEYAEVMGQRPSWFSPTGDGAGKVAKLKTSRFPVDSVTWFDTIEFCNRLSKRDGYAPYYSIERAKFKDMSDAPTRVKILGGVGYRLPTEAEWEYACRAGSTTVYHFGNSGSGGNYAHRGTSVYGVGSNKLSRTTTVGSYKPNNWGIYDMHGNVAEWCSDWYDKSYYANSPATDPTGPPTGDHRVLRGGSWLVKQASCRSAIRFWNVPEKSNIYIGFRIARTPLH